VVKANRDWAQLPVRVRALEDGKLLYMAVPKMATAEPFYLLDPRTLTVPVHEAAEKRQTAQVAPHVGTDAMQPIDVVICGSVAVNRSGARITPTIRSRRYRYSLNRDDGKAAA
jgi:5-formyltetrahydrofolate cyclo-ligase